MYIIGYMIGALFILSGFKTDSFEGVLAVLFGIFLCYAANQAKQRALSKRIDERIRALKKSSTRYDKYKM